MNCKEAAAGRTGLNEDSEDGEEDEEEEMLLENQPLKSEEAEWDLKQAASIDGELKGFMEPSTYATVTQDGLTQELNSSSKELFPKDRAVTKNNKLSPTTIVRKLMKVDEGWNDKTVIKQQIKSEWRRPLSYKCLYPRLYCEECDADCYICGYDEKYLDAHSKNKGWYDTKFINIFSRMVCHVGHSKDPSKKGQKTPNTPELLICVFPVDMASYNNEAIEVIQPKKDRLVVLFCVESHYAVCEVILKDRVMRISDGLDKPLSKWSPQAEYVLKKIGVVPPDTYVNIIGRQMGATIVMNGIPPWNLLPDDFLHQSDEHNCGPIACLKFMDLFHIMPKADIEKSKQTYRQLVTQQYSVLFEKMKFDLVIAQRTSFENIVRGIHIVCTWWEDMSRAAQLNSACDAGAKAILRSQDVTNLPPQEAFPLEPICMFVEGKKMTSDMGAHIRYAAGRQIARSFFHQTSRMFTDAFDEVDWSHVHRTLNGEVPRLFQVWACKQVMNIAATNKNLSRRHRDGRCDKCPCCTIHAETAAHILLCPEVGQMEAFQLGTTALEQWLDEAGTDPDLTDSIVEYVRRRGAITMEEAIIDAPPRFRHMALSQDKIGWRRFLEGMISTEITFIQRQHIAVNGSHMSLDKWCTGLITRLLEITHGQWLYRNYIVRDPVSGIIATARKEELLVEIERQRALGDAGLLEEDKYLAEVNLEEMSTSSGERHHYWLLAIQTARNHYALRAQRESQQMAQSDTTGEEGR